MQTLLGVILPLIGALSMPLVAHVLTIGPLTPPTPAIEPMKIRTPSQVDSPKCLPEKPPEASFLDRSNIFETPDNYQSPESPPKAADLEIIELTIFET